MLVEIHGAGFQNKGAELMLRTAVGELRQLLPQFEPAIDPTYGSYGSRCQLALHQMLPPRSHVGTRGFSGRFLRQRAFSFMGAGRVLGVLGMPPSVYGGAVLSDIRGFVDIAGFAYTDEWGTRPTQDLALLAAYYKGKGVPVILLPQAFGPFHRKETRAAFRQAIADATLVFARDQQSYEHVLELSKDPTKISKAPDITLFYPSDPPGIQAEHGPQYACIIPNMRMLDRGKRSWGDQYHAYMFQVTEELLRLGLGVRVVVHDSTGEDLKIAQRLCEEVASGAVSLVQEEDPLVLKQIVAGGVMVVGSRYHSLVAAFSRHVPAVAIGWSHKYDTLFKEFGMGEFVCSSPDTPVELVLRCVRELADDKSNRAARHKIAQHLEEMRLVNRRMWAQVAGVLADKAASH